MVEMTAFGAAGLAGLALGVWRTPADFLAARPETADFAPAADSARRGAWLDGWRRALGAARAWAHEGETR